MIVNSLLMSSLRLRIMSNHTHFLLGDSFMYKINNIKTKEELAGLLDIPIKKLTYILYVKKVDNMYTTFRIPKKNGGERQINAPEKPLKFIQKKLADILSDYRKNIYDREKINNKISHAFEKEKSFITNAKVHRNKRYVLNFDLKDFFDSFHFGRVKGYFEKNKYFKLPKEVSVILAQLTCYKGCLPQGAPTSPIITNLICSIFDIRVLKLAKKYKLNYTRYADDLSFSTNDKNFLEMYCKFYKELIQEVDKAGFKINETKTRIQYKDSRQEVTGVVINKKLSVNRDYYKKTRAMAYQLYKTGKFFIDGKEGTINQLEGRFSFINQLVWYNNKISKKQEIKKRYIMRKPDIYKKKYIRERDYERFIVYKYFLINEKPLLITEGKTDKLYIQAALRNLYKDYSEIINKNEDTKFEYNISFFNRTNRMNYFLDINQNGADTLKNICDYYINDMKCGYKNYIEDLLKIVCRKPKNPVIILFDNEFAISTKNNKRPIEKLFCNDKISKKKEEIIKNNFVKIKENLYIMTIPLLNGKKSAEIEDLFKEELLNKEIYGKKFNRESNDNEKYISKDTFSKYVKSHYKDIDFSDFRPLLDNIKTIITNYKNEMSGKNNE